MSESKWAEYFKEMRSTIIRNREVLNLKISEGCVFALMTVNDHPIWQNIFASPDDYGCIICDGFIVGFEEEMREGFFRRTSHGKRCKRNH